jgi:hypothetical protein
MRARDHMTRHRLLSGVREVLRARGARHDRDQSILAAPPPAPLAANPASAPPPPLPAPDMAQLEAEARYHRDRLALYRARVYGAQPTSQTRLRELERASAAADERLRHASRT